MIIIIVINTNMSNDDYKLILSIILSIEKNVSNNILTVIIIIKMFLFFCGWHILWTISHYGLQITDSC